METLSASDIGKGLDANGRVAIYGILFDTNKADIQPASKASLDQIGALLKQQTALKLHVVGHTDNVGTLPANLDLSRRRADAVAAVLARHHIRCGVVKHFVVAHQRRKSGKPTQAFLAFSVNPPT